MTPSKPAWDLSQYNRFEQQRDRAAFDLLMRLPDDLRPRDIWDLGCGGGQHAAMLQRRYPEARVHGLDSSEPMLASARALTDAVDWRVGDISAWAPEQPTDLILANASLQWLPDHELLLARLANALASGGVLAVQMPMAFETAHHRILRETAADGPWAPRLAGVDRISPLLPAEAYYNSLAPLCSDIDIWSTTYLHVLDGEDAVLEWMKGTALRPALTVLADDPLRPAFLSALGARLASAFPRRPDGATLLPFPRLFLVARRR